MSISGLVVEYIVAIDVTRIRFRADALSFISLVLTLDLADRHAHKAFALCLMSI